MQSTPDRGNAIPLRSALWVEHAGSGYYPNIYYATLCRADEFLPGVAVAMLKNFHRAAWDRLLRRGHLNLAAGLLAVAVAATPNGDSVDRPCRSPA